MGPRASPKKRSPRKKPTVEYIPSWDDCAAETWINLFHMKDKDQVSTILARIDEKDDGYHPISFQLKTGVRYL